jgi:hypothetical protein
VSLGEWNGDEWVAGGGFQRGAGVLCRFTGPWCTVHASTELDGVDGVSGRRCKPSLDVGVAVSVAQRLSLGCLGFSPGASESWPAWVGSIGERARREWLGIARWSPCTVVRGTGAARARARVHENVSPALRGLGGAVVSERHDQGDALGRFRTRLVQGIDPVGRGKSGGEVTARAVAGGALSMLRCPRWPW